jgi:hypothetical protein
MFQKYLADNKLGVVTSQTPDGRVKYQVSRKKEFSSFGRKPALS